jgi:hypothetical protein
MALADERHGRLGEGFAGRPVLVCELDESANLELGDDAIRESPYGKEPDPEQGPVPDEVARAQVPGRDLAAVARSEIPTGPADEEHPDARLIGRGEDDVPRVATDRSSLVEDEPPCIGRDPCEESALRRRT